MTARKMPALSAELEGGGHEQTWGQGEGHHDPTIDGEDEQQPASYVGNTQAGDQDPATRSPRPDGPMFQPADPADASDELGESPDATYGQREGQADSETGEQAG